MVNLTDDEIKTALECCVKPKVGKKCPRAKFADVCNNTCIQFLMEQVLDLINRKDAEIERLEIALNATNSKQIDDLQREHIEENPKMSDDYSFEVGV